MITDLLTILLVVVIALLFWQQRRQSEQAHQHIRQYCQRMELQLLSIARGRHTMVKTKAGWRWVTYYWFEFSATGNDHYTGQAQLYGLRLKAIDTPVHTMPGQSD
ncbi:hypothetical protein BZG78_09490 [Salinivibrio sp. MA351]|uniref:DUF3301 domain-containing protein n=1 Tax=Salinivibrio costicola subsp. alcaliphilus TaxID=272773 RepID=A0ABX3KR60_SALCS|nr:MULTISPECIES: DUF3301 domain-containing protein [Salinivibrio]NUY56793.1 DUF3301 domain-containing protein [Salinivibrio sp. EAGSL]OOE92147.1 hypothetical protein BZG75_09505 [Salinivibrio sp. AR640]OOE94121.1 hypothetical protein BZG76_00165 [Salinivibrio sp. AR647]OOE98254.1 hypothetical protein BZG78_09490 [Salinivibrio sp. MA351]OOF04159.1 hypothetical protein BZG81_09960 [Salinivibrio sp. MA607]